MTLLGVKLDKIRLKILKKYSNHRYKLNIFGIAKLLNT